MSGQISRPLGSIVLVATLLMSGAGVTAPASADDCLASPNSPAPQGSHWYYRLDWATQRKCWYARAPGPPVQQAAAPATLAGVPPLHSMPAPSGPILAADGAPMSVSPGDTAPPPARVKIPAVKPKSAQAITETTDKFVHRSAQEENTAPSTIEAPAPQASTSPQTSAQAPGPAPATPAAWPDAPSALALDAPGDSVPDDAERTARGSEPTNNTGMPMIIFPLLALGLTVVGLLSMKIAAARRARTIIDHPGADRVDDQRQHEWRDGQDQHGPVDERREYHSLVSAVSDPFRAEGGADQITHEISRRRDKLAQLHQDLDRLLQSPTAA
jgi:hypothetical protein